MERLTVFDGEFWVHKNFSPVGEDTVDEFVDCVKELAARLAAYEDTGLEPDTISGIRDIVLDIYGDFDRLRELVQADREGLVVLLPFPQHRSALLGEKLTIGDWRLIDQALARAEG